MADKIFINYRRDDRPAHATLVRDRLASVYGPSKIFMDVANLLPGEQFAERLEKELAGCDVLLAIIGPKWLELLEARLATGERDYVREEIGTALKRRIIVVPVLVDRAELPPASRLPEDIRSLLLYQKHGLTHERVDRDTGELIAAINAVREKTRAEAAPTRQPPLNAPRTLRVLLGGIAAAVVLLAVSFGISSWQKGRVPDTGTGQKSGTELTTPAPLDPTSEAEREAIAAARATKSISAFEDYLAKVNQHTFKGTFRDEARRSIADLERWERTDKRAVEALKAYLGSAGKPLMADEARKTIAALIEAAEREACEAYATTALEQIGRAKALGCGVTGDKWSARKVVQISECVELKTDDARRARTGERNQELTQCQNDKDEAEAWRKLQTVLEQEPVKSTTKAKAKAETAPPELVGLGDKITSLSTEIAAINAFLASNPNKASGKFANEARAAIDGRSRQVEGLKAKTLDMDRALWAKAQATPNSAEGYKTYLAILPEGEHSKAEVEAILADLEACEAARKADDMWP